jgi:hypothetical protein
MRDNNGLPTILADDVGIHFVVDENEAVIVHWGEIVAVCALREQNVDGTPYIRVFVDSFYGVDFRFTSVEMGYEQTTAEMEKHLIGFKRAALEAVSTFEEAGKNIPVVWKRDEAVQPFELSPPVIDRRPPTPAEQAQMKAAHQASIATCEEILGRQLEPHEIACVQTDFENGRIVGNILAPLCHRLVECQKPQ